VVAINLIPEAIQSAQARRRHAARWGVLIAIAALAWSVSWVAHWNQHTRVDELTAINDQLQADLLAARTELKTLSAQADELLLRTERARTLREKRCWSSMLALIASCLPRECWLTSLATDPASPAGGPGPSQVRKPPAPSAGGSPPSPPAADRPERGPSSPQKSVALQFEAPRKLRILGNAGDPVQPLAFVARLKEARVFRDVVLEQTHRAGDERESLFKFEVLCEW